MQPTNQEVSCLLNVYDDITLNKQQKVLGLSGSHYLAEKKTLSLAI